MVDTTEWEVVASACRRVNARLDVLTSRIVDRIWDEIPAYREAAITGEDHHHTVSQHQRIVLDAVMGQRELTAEDVAFASEIGRRRATQGLPLHALIQAYNVAYRELWAALIAEAGASRGEIPGVMALAAGQTWDSVQRLSATVAEAHEESARARDLLRARIHRRFIELLAASDVPEEVLFDLARSLGFDPDGKFQALCIAAGNLEGEQLERLESAVRHIGRARCIVPDGELIVILWQRAPAFEVQEAVERVAGGHPAGVGVMREGLSGARLSIGDAERALAIALRRRGDVTFSDDWLACVALQLEERLAVLLEPGFRVAEAQPELLETVTSFAENGFSIAATARALYLHPNTATYRLARWKELTGWDPRSFRGLTKAVVCGALGERVARDVTEQPSHEHGAGRG
ncbi:MAG: helix-turn-helix domain-containing protein [Thermoleophilaceae bacterium]